MTSLPPRDNLGGAPKQGTFRTAIGQLHDFIRERLVDGSHAVGNFIAAGFSAAGATAGLLAITAGDIVEVVKASPLFRLRDTNASRSAGDVIATFDFYGATGTAQAKVSVQAIAAHSDGSAADLAIMTRGPGGALTEVMRITHDNRIGIGTADPSKPLHLVNGAVTGSTAAVNAQGVFEATGGAHIQLITDSGSDNKLIFSDAAGSPGYIMYDHATDSLVVVVAGVTAGHFDATGNWSVGASSSRARITAEASGSGATVLDGRATGSSFTGNVASLDAVAVAGTGWNVIRARADVGGTPDLIFRLRGDGACSTDGAFTGGGADYAEMFEWADPPGAGEDRIGLSVVHAGEGKIRPALEADNVEAIIGITSATAVVLGDAAALGWSGKWERDAFGRVLTEPAEIAEWIDASGAECSAWTDFPPAGGIPETALRRPARRPSKSDGYDPSLPYTPREERPEWAAIGVMGKLRLRKGQPVKPSWIWLRDINEEVQEWLVR